MRPVVYVYRVWEGQASGTEPEKGIFYLGGLGPTTATGAQPLALLAYAQGASVQQLAHALELY